MPTRAFRFEFYSVHGHVEDRPVDYQELVSALTRFEGYHEAIGNYHVFVRRASLDNGQLFLVIYTGYSETSTLFFDLAEKAELTEATRPGRFQARKVHAMLDAGKRIVGIESKRGALGASSLSELIETFLRRAEDYKTLELTFNPIAGRDFLERLNEFRRIQAATITLARPNVDWTDRHDQLTQVASESDAGTLDVTAHAKRGKGLSKDNGLIAFIKSARSIFKKIKIVGNLTEDSPLISLNLSKHVERTDVVLDTDANTGLPNEGEVRSKLSGLLRGMKPEDGET